MKVVGVPRINGPVDVGFEKMAWKFLVKIRVGGEVEIKNDDIFNLWAGLVEKF